MLFKKLLRTAWHYKAQFFSMILMIAIGTGVFLGFNIEWYSIEMDTSAFFEDTNYADFRLYSDTGFSEDDIRAIQDINGVDAATRYLSVNADIDGGKAVSLSVSESNTVSTVLVTRGAAYDEASDGIWLSDRFAECNGYRLGDTVTLNYQSMKISGQIVGLIKSGEHMICTADENQLMPDYDTFGFAYISPSKLKSAGVEFYPQINLRSGLEKAELEKAVKKALGRTILVMDKENHTAYAGAMSEAEEGKTMGAILPVLFLAIAVLTMVTTMHRITANEKIQIGTLKALGFRDRRILRHYTSYGFLLGAIGTLLGVLLGYGIATIVISPHGMMSTYFDLPDWSLSMPWFCPVILGLVVFLLTMIGYFSVKKMMAGTAADTLRPYAPKKMKRSLMERAGFWERMSFGAKWNIRDILRHKSRSAMTLVGVVGCMLLLVGGLGMKDTMAEFMGLLDGDISNYVTKVNLSETADPEEAKALAEYIDGDWMASSGISYSGETTVMEIYRVDHNKIRFMDKANQPFQLKDNGVYLCLRLADTANVGDMIEISPYGSEDTYRVRVAGYLRSVISESIVMTDEYAESVGIPYRLTAIYTDKTTEEIEYADSITSKQDKQKIMDTYDSFMDIMNIMVLIFILAAVVLGAVVLYNLGVMSYMERSRELATLKVLGFRDRRIGRLLVSQNIWLTVIGVLIGLPAGVGVLQVLLITLADEYEMKLTLGILTYSVSILLTFGVSLAVSWAVARKNRKINMVEALKCAE